LHPVSLHRKNSAFLRAVVAVACGCALRRAGRPAFGRPSQKFEQCATPTTIHPMCNPHHHQAPSSYYVPGHRMPQQPSVRTGQIGTRGPDPMPSYLPPEARPLRFSHLSFPSAASCAQHVHTRFMSAALTMHYAVATAASCADWPAAVPCCPNLAQRLKPALAYMHALCPCSQWAIEARVQLRQPVCFQCTEAR
jgi:hypothetical protein